MKRPWILTPKGQRATLHTANLVALVLFVGFVLQFNFVEQPRRNVPQLDTANVTYCELSSCGEMFGVELDDGQSAVASATQTEIGVQLELHFTNSSRYEGRRELWLRMESQDGSFIEAASTWLEFDLKNRSVASFLITGTLAEISQSRLFIGY